MAGGEYIDEIDSNAMMSSDFEVITTVVLVNFATCSTTISEFHNDVFVHLIKRGCTLSADTEKNVCITTGRQRSQYFTVKARMAEQTEEANRRPVAG